jgi:NDP-sugar pyrophosphorylase family protein
MVAERIRTAVVLAAGLGRRMWPYGEVRPKASLPILNKPLVLRLLEELAAIGIDRIVIVVGFQERRIRHDLAGRDGIRFVRQQSAQGTAAAVLEALPLIEDPAFLIVYGDLLLDRGDLRTLLEVFSQSTAPLAAMVRAMDEEDGRDWLGATVSEGRLRGVIGHSAHAAYRLCGVYALRQAAIPYLETNAGLMTHVPVGGMPPIEAELAESVAAMVDSGLELPAVAARGIFVDLDKPWHILEANEAAIRAAAAELEGVQVAPGGAISDGADIRGPVVLEEGARIGARTLVQGPLWVGRDTVIENGPMLGPGVVIGAGCRVANYCQIGGGSTIGPRGVVDHAAEFSGVTMDRVYLYHYMEFWGVIGSAVDLGAATVCGNLRFDDGQTVHRVLGRGETPRHGANAVYLGDYSRTGVNAILMPGVKVGPYSCVGPGVVVYDDVPSHTLLLLRQELVRKEWGSTRYGW